jgi:hypothetical protein
VGIDTYSRDRGEFRLPGVLGLGIGVEFYLALTDSTEGRLFVSQSYNPYIVPRAGMGPTDLDPFYNFLCTVESRSDAGQFDSLFVTTNRFRVTRDGTMIPARGVDRGRLRYGRASDSSLSDWYVDRRTGPGRLIEVRLPWALLNVTDPSSRTVLTGIREGGPQVGGVVSTTTTDGFRFVVAGLSRANDRITAYLPGDSTYVWPTWEEPSWHEHLKPAYYAMRDLWGSW